MTIMPNNNTHEFREASTYYYNRIEKKSQILWSFIWIDNMLRLLRWRKYADRFAEIWNISINLTMWTTNNWLNNCNYYLFLETTFPWNLKLKYTYTMESKPRIISSLSNRSICSNRIFIFVCVRDTACGKSKNETENVFVNFALSDFLLDFWFFFFSDSVLPAKSKQ